MLFRSNDTATTEIYTLSLTTLFRSDGVPPGNTIVFTWMTLADEKWLGQDHTVTVGMAR